LWKVKFDRNEASHAVMNAKDVSPEVKQKIVALTVK
jgi:hypothetical protein